MKKVIFIHNTTGKEFVIKCENVKNKSMDNAWYYVCEENKSSEVKTTGIFPFAQYAMYVSKVYGKSKE